MCVPLWTRIWLHQCEELYLWTSVPSDPTWLIKDLILTSKKCSSQTCLTADRTTSQHDCLARMICVTQLPQMFQNSAEQNSHCTAHDTKSNQTFRQVAPDFKWVLVVSVFCDVLVCCRIRDNTCMLMLSPAEVCTGHRNPKLICGHQPLPPTEMDQGSHLYQAAPYVKPGEGLRAKALNKFRIRIWQKLTNTVIFTNCNCVPSYALHRNWVCNPKLQTNLQKCHFTVHKFWMAKRWCISWRIPFHPFAQRQYWKRHTLRLFETCWAIV